MRPFMLLLLVVASLSYATTKSYDVVPFKNYIGVQTNGRDGVSQYYRNTLDSLTEVWFWVGDAGDTSNHFTVEVRDSATTQLIASKANAAARMNWYWMPCTLNTESGVEPIRGRTYKVVVTRPSGAAISFAYDPTDKYRYGDAAVPNSTPPLPAGSRIPGTYLIHLS